MSSRWPRFLQTRHFSDQSISRVMGWDLQHGLGWAHFLASLQQVADDDAAGRQRPLGGRRCRRRKLAGCGGGSSTSLAGAPPPPNSMLQPPSFRRTSSLLIPPPRYCPTDAWFFAPWPQLQSQSQHCNRHLLLLLVNPLHATQVCETRWQEAGARQSPAAVLARAPRPPHSFSPDQHMPHAWGETVPGTSAHTLANYHSYNHPSSFASAASDKQRTFLSECLVGCIQPLITAGLIYLAAEKLFSFPKLQLQHLASGRLRRHSFWAALPCWPGHCISLQAPGRNHHRVHQ